MTNHPDRSKVGNHLTIYTRGKAKIFVADFWNKNQHQRLSLKNGNKKVAVQRAVELDANLTAGTYKTPPAPTTIRQAADAYFEFLRTEGRADSTLVRYTGELDNFQALVARLQVTRLAQITPTTFDRFRAHCKQLGHFPATMFHESIVVKQWLKWCHRRRLVAENALVDYKLDKPKREPREGPNLEQINQILAAAHGQRQVQYAILAFTGMRSGDARRLLPEDIDLARGWIKIVSRKGAETKTRRSRKVPIHPRLHAILETMPKTKRPWFFTAGPSPRYPRGDHCMNCDRLNDDFLGLLRKLKIAASRKENGFTIHTLRNFFETFCVNARVPQRAIDSWLGHSSDQSMAAVYYKLSDVDSKAFMDEVPFGDGMPAANAGDKKE